MGLCGSKPSRIDPGTPIDVASSSEEGTPTKTEGLAQLAGAAPGEQQRTSDGVRVSRPQALATNLGGLARQDSPETNRTTTRILPRNRKDDEIVTVWQQDEDIAPSGPTGSRTSPQQGTRARQAYGLCDTAADGRGSNGPSGLTRADSVKASSPAILTFQGGLGTAGRAGGAGGPTSHDDLEESLQQLGPGATGGRGGKTRLLPAPGEMVLSLSDDDELDVDVITSTTATAAGFSMRRWKRHYHWNKNKHKDLLRFLWRHYDRKAWTFYCITYRHQSGLFTSYQGENVIHGLACRMEDLALGGRPAPGSDDKDLGPPMRTSTSGEEEPLFAVLHTLMDHNTNKYKVVGLVLARGTGGSPACLTGLQELHEQWTVLPADVSDPLVRTFVSNLLTGQPPSPHCSILHTREVV